MKIEELKKNENIQILDSDYGARKYGKLNDKYAIAYKNYSEDKPHILTDENGDVVWFDNVFSMSWNYVWVELDGKEAIIDDSKKIFKKDDYDWVEEVFDMDDDQWYMGLGGNTLGYFGEDGGKQIIYSDLGQIILRADEIIDISNDGRIGILYRQGDKWGWLDEEGVWNCDVDAEATYSSEEEAEDAYESAYEVIYLD